MTEPNNEQIEKELTTRFATTESVRALEDRLSPESLKQAISSLAEGLDDNDPFVRKMRFGSTDSSLVGSKYARYGYTVADLEFLMELQLGMEGQRRVNGSGVYKGPSQELRNAFNSVSAAHYLTDEQVRAIDQKALDDVFPRVNKRQVHAYEAALRAMDTAESGFGSQLIGAQYVGDLWEAARPASTVFGLINTFEMTAPTAYLPVEVDMPEMLLVSESTANNSSNYTTVKTGSNRVTVTASKFVIHQMWSGEMEEDSIIPFVPFLRAQLAKSLAFYSDSLVINGDTTNSGTGNINLDDADPADTKHYLAFDGIRHGWLVDATGQGVNVAGAISLNTLRDLRGLMVDNTYYHDWGHPIDRNQLVYLCDVATGDRIALLDEVVSAKIQNGNAADLLNGQVTSILGHPVVTSIAYSKTEADGKVSTTPGNNTLGQVSAFNRMGLTAGWRRRVKIETERLPATDQTRIVASLRMGLGRYTPTGAASGIKWAAGARNITL